MRRVVCKTRRSWSSGEHGRIVVEVGERILVRTDGGSPTAQKYAGKRGRVTTISPGFERIILDIRIESSNLDVVLEEGDLSTKEGEAVFEGFFSGLEAQSELNRLLDELFDEGLVSLEKIYSRMT